jgi:hypothetical protein
LEQEFASDFVIRQSAAESFFGPMTVQVERSSVTSGTTGAVFDNDGGLLRLSEIDFADVIGVALVATANNGASFLEQSTISRKSGNQGDRLFVEPQTNAFCYLLEWHEVSDVNSITYTTAGGSQSALNTSVTQMSRMEDAFYVEDVGSTLLLEGMAIEQNNMQTVPWSVVSVRTNAIARVSESSISDNTALEFGVVAFSSTVSIQDSFISRNSGSVSCKDRTFWMNSLDKELIPTYEITFPGTTRYNKRTRLCNH